MPKRDVDYMESQRRRIMRATLICIAERGIQKTTILDICTEAQLSAGAVYGHFEHKEDLVISLIHFFGSKLDYTPPQTWAELKQSLCVSFDPLEVSSATMSAAMLNMRAECLKPGPVGETIKQLAAKQVDFRTQSLRSLQERGELILTMSAEDTSLYLTSLIEGTIWLNIQLGRPPEQGVRDFNRFADHVVQLPAPKAARRKRATPRRPAS